MHGQRERADEKQDTDDNFYQHSGFSLPHTSYTLSLVGYCLILRRFASLFALRLLGLLLIDATLTSVTMGLWIIYAAVVSVELTTAFHAFNNMLSHGMSNLLRYISVVLTFNTIITYSRVKVKKNVDH